MALGVGAVEFPDRGFGVFDVLVGDEGDALGAAGTVVAECDLGYGAHAVEEVLCCLE